MPFIHILFQLFIEPLLVLFEYIFGWSSKLIGDSALALIPLSLAVNLLCLPLYRRADALRIRTLEQQKRMEPGLKHIRACFKGDERFMMTQAYYRISGYKPVYALRNSLSLLLQIPFFIAAYVMLSNLPAFQEKSLGIIPNLGAPDKLLIVEGLTRNAFTINVLPILMTLINIVSATVYGRRGSGWSDRLQTYGLALVFLLLLYNSASGLVLYWILNQLFSLGKNIFDAFIKKSAAISETLPTNREAVSFFLGGAFLCVLAGALIPSAVIRSSVSSFVNVWDYHTPLLHVVNASLTALGAFVFWPGVFYFLSGQKGRRALAVGMWCLSGVAIVDYMFFGENPGILQYTLTYEVEPDFLTGRIVVNLLAATAVVALFVLVWKKWNKSIKPVQVIMIAVAAVMTLSNCIAILRELPDIMRVVANNTKKNDFSIPLSKTGKNVVVLMLDKAISLYVPFIFNEKPELQEKFSGFTYYPNSLSFGAATNTGSPALFGGYEYTPEEMNKRDTELLVDKHNEALCVMPRLFSDNGFETTVFEPPYAGYKEPADLSIFNPYPRIRAYNTAYWQSGVYAAVETIWEKNFFCYSLMKMAPLALQRPLYQKGQYSDDPELTHMLNQVCGSPSMASGVRASFMDNYAMLESLPDLTRNGESGNTFLMMTNNTTHEPMLLKEPEYEPSMSVDNTEYDRTHTSRFTVEGRTLPLQSVEDMMYYQTNMAVMLKLGAWFDYLKEQGVYDNTRIILVSDHGKPLGYYRNYILSKEMNGDIFRFNPLLMVKDFDQTQFKVDYTFMTNADTPSLAFDGLIENPVNPATGKAINADAKYAEELHVANVTSGEWNVGRNNGYKFSQMYWTSVKNRNIFEIDNWTYIGTK